MKSESPESGLEELLRLSKQITGSAQEQAKTEQERAKKRQNVQGIQQGLKEIKVSVALNQLKLIATPEIIEEVSSLQDKHGTENLRKRILDLSAELEKWVDSASHSKPDMVSIKRSVKTLAILIELLLSLE